MNVGKQDLKVMSSLSLFLAIQYFPYFHVSSLPTSFLYEVIIFSIRLQDSNNNNNKILSEYFKQHGIYPCSKNSLNMTMISFPSCSFTITHALKWGTVIAKFWIAWDPRGIFTSFISQAEVFIATTVRSNNVHIDEKTAEQTEVRQPFVFEIQQAHKAESVSSALTLSTGSIYNMLILS